MSYRGPTRMGGLSPQNVERDERVQYRISTIIHPDMTSGHRRFSHALVREAQQHFI